VLSIVINQTTRMISQVYIGGYFHCFSCGKNNIKLSKIKESIFFQLGSTFNATLNRLLVFIFSPLLKCWKKQLIIAKEYRIVYVLCCSSLLAQKLVKVKK